MRWIVRRSRDLAQNQPRRQLELHLVLLVSLDLSLQQGLVAVTILLQQLDLCLQGLDENVLLPVWQAK
jgi:hypothetical protein